MLKNTFTVNPITFEVVTERVINASAAKLFEVYTDPLLIPKWWGDPALVTTVERFNLNEGGSWRFIQTEPNGTIIAWDGIYQEIVAPSKIVSTFVLEPQPGHVYIGTALFTPLSDKTTKYTETIKFLNLEDMNQLVNMDVQNKSATRVDRLARLVEN